MIGAAFLLQKGLFFFSYRPFLWNWSVQSQTCRFGSPATKELSSVRIRICVTQGLFSL